MAGDAVASAGSSLPGAPLKGRHATFMKKHLAIGIGMSLLSVYLTKVFLNDKRQAAYAEYYKWVQSFFNHRMKTVYTVLTNFFNFKTTVFCFFQKLWHRKGVPPHQKSWTFRVMPRRWINSLIYNTSRFCLEFKQTLPKPKLQCIKIACKTVRRMHL